MNFYSFERIGVERTARLRKEAAVTAIVRASGTPTTAQTAARALRRLAERLDHGQQRSGRTPAEVTQPTLILARSAT